DHLDAADQLVVMRDTDPELYGVLRARPGSGLESRAVSGDTALLFLTLAEPGVMPRYALRVMGEEAQTPVARSVLAVVLEIQSGTDFVWGLRSAQSVLPETTPVGSGRAAALSIAALRYGADLVGLTPRALGYRLYHFGRQPISPELRARYPDEA